MPARFRGESGDADVFMPPDVDGEAEAAEPIAFRRCAHPFGLSPEHRRLLDGWN